MEPNKELELYTAIKADVAKLSYPELQAKVKESGLTIPLNSKGDALLEAYTEFLLKKEIEKENSIPAETPGNTPPVETPKKPEVKQAVKAEEPKLIAITNGKKVMNATPEQCKTLLAPVGIWRKVSDVEAELAAKKLAAEKGDDRPKGYIKITNGRKTIFANPFNIQTLLKPLGNFELCEGEKLPDHVEAPKEPEHEFYTKPQLLAMAVDDNKKVRGIYQKLTGSQADLDWNNEELAIRIILAQEELKAEILKKNAKREELIS